MTRRPLLFLWIALMTAVWIARTAGLPLPGEPVLPPEVRTALEEGRTAMVTGTVGSRQIREKTVQYVLHDVSIVFGNRQTTVSNILLFAARAASDSNSSQVSLRESRSDSKTEYGTAPAEASQMRKEGILSIGSLVSLRGECAFTETAGNPGQFDSRQYYACRKIWVQAYLPAGKAVTVLRRGRGLPEKLCEWREALAGQLLRQVPGEGAGVLAAMLLGDRSMLDDELRLNWQAASLYHMISISGMHITLLGMLVFRLLLLLLTLPVRPGGGLSSSVTRLCLQAASAAGASAAMSLFCVFTGSAVSAVRAWIMFGVMLGARVMRRSYDSLSALSLAGILLLLENPGYLFYAGFQLSAGAVLSISVVLPGLKSLLPENFYMEGSRRKEVFRGILLAGFLWLSVTAGMLPLLAWHFYEIPLLGLPAGLLAAPLAGALLIWGAAGLAAGILWPAAGRVMLAPAGLAIRLMNLLAGRVRRLPFSVWVCGRPSLRRVLLYYCLLGAACVLLRTAAEKRHGPRAKEKKRSRSGAGLRRAGAAAAFAAGIAVLAFRVPPPFSLVMLDVGQGDGLVLTFSSGRPFAGETVFLSDGGSSDVREVGAYRILPYLKQRGISRIDGIFVSHPDEDHINGIEELLELCAGGGRPRIGRLLLPVWMREDPAAERLLQLAAQAQVPAVFLKAGDRILIGRAADGDGQEEEQAAAPAGGGPAENAENSTEYRSDPDNLQGLVSEIHVLHPLAAGGAREGNAGSLVLHVQCGGFTALLTGDLEGEGEEDIRARLPDVTCLKAAHHGSRFSTDSRFLSAAGPELTLISCGRGNRYGHPHEELLERLEDCGSAIYRTDRDGAVTLEYDGRRLSVYVFRAPENG